MSVVNQTYVGGTGTSKSVVHTKCLHSKGRVSRGSPSTIPHPDGSRG